MPDLNEAERHLLLCLWDRRDKRSRVETLAELQAREDVHGPSRAHELGPALEPLRRRGLVEPRGETWTLTSEGISAAQDAFRRLMLDGFSESLVRNAKSEVFAEYCRRVNGVDLFQFNVVDATQLDHLVSAVGLSSGDRFADLGCAVGSLTSEIARRTGAFGVGLDFAETAIVRASERAKDNDRLSFVVGDMNAIELPGGPFDAIVAVDTLYFVDDLRAVVGDILARLTPGGRFAAFYSHTRREGQPAECLTANGSPLARALQHQGAAYEATDFTQSAHELWKRAVVASAALERAWKDAGESESWLSRDRENRERASAHEAGIVARHLYVATAPSL